MEGLEEEEEFMEIEGIVHPAFKELDDKNWYGSVLKPSEFPQAVKHMVGLPVTLDHTKDEQGNIVGGVGKVKKAWIDDQSGAIMANIHVPINSEYAKKVQHEVLDNNYNPRRSLSFGSDFVLGIGPGVPGISDKTVFNAEIVFNHISLVDVPGVPGAKVKKVDVGKKNLKTGEIQYIRKAIYKNAANLPKIVNKEELKQMEEIQPAQASQPASHVVRQTPTNMESVRVGPPPGGSMEEAQRKQDQELGIQKQQVVLSATEQLLLTKIQEMKAESAKLAQEKAAHEAIMIAAKKEKEELDAYNERLRNEKKQREEDELRKQNAKALEEEKALWAAAEIEIMADGNATAIAEFIQARDQHFNAVATGTLAPALKWQKFAQDCNAKLTLSGVQHIQQQQAMTNNETLRILEEEHKKAKEELEKERKQSEELTTALMSTSARVADPKVAFDILQYVKQKASNQANQANQGTQGTQGTQTKQPEIFQMPPKTFVTHLNGNGPQPTPPQVDYDSNLSFQENFKKNVEPILFGEELPTVQYEVIPATASRVIEQDPTLKQFPALAMFAADFPDHYKRMRNLEAVTVIPTSYGP